jgi:hypothetical protein
MERPFWDRSKWKNGQRTIRISRPILIGQDDEAAELCPPPLPAKDDKYQRGISRRVKLDVISSSATITVKQLSSSVRATPAGHLRLSDASPQASPRGKTMYPGFKGIPGDLPCHERYVPMQQSRSTAALEKGGFYSPGTGDEADFEDDIEPDEGWSDDESVYSQDEIPSMEPLHVDPVPR